MKHIFLKALLLLSLGAAAQTPQQVSNQYAFAKTYGYLKYFYPGDDAAKIDWDRFAYYGARKVEDCKTPDQLKDSLNAMVRMLMPGVQIVKSSDPFKFDAEVLTPKDLTGYNVIAWQHLGVGLVKEEPTLYKSARTNRPQVFKSIFKGFGNASMYLKSKEYAGKTVEFNGRAKMVNGTGDGHFWLRADKAEGKIGFFDNMDNRPIVTKEWTPISIKGKLEGDIEAIGFGTFLSGVGTLLVDDLRVKVDGKEIYSTDFEKDAIGAEPKSITVATGRSSVPGLKYSFSVAEESGNKYLVLTSPSNSEKVLTVNKKPFEQHVPFGTYVKKPIGNNLDLIVPLALYGTKEHTFPLNDSLRINASVSKINDRNYILNGSDLYFRLGNTTNAWNVFQHFFPYFDVAKTNWEQDLKDALKKCYTDKNDADYLSTLETMTAKLKDGHISISHTGSRNNFMAPISWKWIGDQLIITTVKDKTVKLQKGDVVQKVNGEDAKRYFRKVNSYISAATVGYLNYRAETESLIGQNGEPFTLELTTGTKVKLLKNLSAYDYYQKQQKQDTIKSLGNNITYINIPIAKMSKIEAAMPLLEGSKAIICDLRGYPTDNAPLIEHLMVKDDTSTNWMKIPKIIYPDQEKIVGYEEEGWGLKAKSPHLKAKIFFLTDGQAISYAESYMSFIEHYKLATIIGQPTAGTNGNVNFLTLPGGYSLRFTGMKVVKQNGSRLHGVGIIPDITVEQTVSGIKEGRDEVLERAVAEASKL